MTLGSSESLRPNSGVAGETKLQFPLTFQLLEVDASHLFRTAQEVKELPDGYAIRFANEPGKFMEIANFIEHDRLCCPFFQFGVDVEPNAGPLWLQLTGGDGIKDMLKITLFESMQDQEALKTFIHTGGDARLQEVVAQTEFPHLTGILQQTEGSK
jgi:hypothetical protein